MKILKSEQFINEKMKIIPITNDEFDKVNESFIKLLEKPKKSDLEEGDVCITEENSDTRNLYIVAKGSTVNYLYNIDKKDFVLIQPDENYGNNAIHIELRFYDEKLKYSGSSEYDIKFVFRTNLKPTDFDREDKILTAMHSVYTEICKAYPNEAKEIEIL